MPGVGNPITFETDDEACRRMHEHHDMGRITATVNPVTGPLYVEGAGPGGGGSVHLPGTGVLAGQMGENRFTRPVEISSRPSCPPTSPAGTWT